MNLELENIINKEGIFKTIKFSFLKNNYFSIYEQLREYKSTYFFNDDLPSSQLVYLFLHELKTIPLCQCGKSVKFESFSRGYRKYCSNKCSATSEEKKRKIIKTVKKRYGETNVSKVKEVKEKKKDTFKKNYNKEHVWSKKDGEERSCLKKYGTDNVFKLKEAQVKGILDEGSDLNINNVKNIPSIIVKYLNDTNISVLEYRTKIIPKQVFLSMSEEELELSIDYLYDFLKNIQPTFPYEPVNYDINLIIKKIQNYNFLNIENNVFLNNISSIGSLFLKQSFPNFYSCSNKNNLSPVESWNNEKLTKSIIRYRIGLNNSRETFDFSLHQIVRGLSAYRKMVSFFKPIVAASIYKHFLGNIKTPIVIDPCAGFGGRLLGFKSIYPEGKYIGIEPNKETFKNLEKLATNFNNIELHNCKLEDYQGSKECDLTFTSIPYFDLENYNEDFNYKSFENWNNTFINSLLSFNSLLINLPIFLQEQINIPFKDLYYLTSNTSHFRKDKNLTSKNEYILKCF